MSVFFSLSTPLLGVATVVPEEVPVPEVPSAGAEAVVSVVSSAA